MRRSLWMIAIALACGCGKAPSITRVANSNAEVGHAAGRHDTDAFFVKWFEAHGHSDVVVDADGVGVRSSPTRLQASLYGSKHNGNKDFVVEMEFTVRLPSKREITEFVAGVGETEQRAINDSLVNFTLTTFHVVYKGFINAADPHAEVTPMVINGTNRDVILGDILMRGGASNKNIDLHAMRAEVQGALQKQPLTQAPHWIKIVYSQVGGKPMTVAATLDNGEDRELTDAVTRLHWPRSDGFYLAKQFIVIK